MALWPPLFTIALWLTTSSSIAVGQSSRTTLGLWEVRDARDSLIAAYSIIKSRYLTVIY